MDVLAAVLRRAEADPGVLGVILTGSHARGLATEHSDVDVTVVVAEQATPWRHASRTAVLDEVVCTAAALGDTSVQWARYGYRGAQVLLDRLDGGIAALVERQATLTPEEAAARGRAALDAYLNQRYRAAKNQRAGAVAAARLDAAECVPWLLETVFALHGRLRPYNAYLRWELDTYPLPDPWRRTLRPERVAVEEHFAAVEALARARGHADVLAGWGEDLGLIRSFAG
ncbi:nucleotidyltransferase domain-containing protein [Dactylosporangium sp. NPDC051541]|uniref:nucleotidyltransferase domain-containing protein n=1 Tax=Dactylosporangium sp. NPDC051541 TaxID=3363977 RepID=UPI00379269DB